MTNRIEPCIFCGCSGHKTHDEAGMYTTIECLRCGFTLGPINGVQDCIDEWNSLTLCDYADNQTVSIEVQHDS